MTTKKLVKVVKGHKAISEIKVGDYVYFENNTTGEKAYKKVKQVFVNEVITLYHIKIADQEIKTTAPHPFYVIVKGWVEAEDLVVGDQLKLANGETIKVEAITIENLKEPIKVYNFEVEDWHVYYVSDMEILVHNTGVKPCSVGNVAEGGSTSFYKAGGGSNLDDFMTVHAEKHVYNPDVISTKNKTQFGENIDVAKLRQDTMLNPDKIVHDLDQNVIKYEKEYDFNISTPDTPTGSHRVFINLEPKPGKMNRNSQFPYFKGDK